MEDVMGVEYPSTLPYDEMKLQNPMTNKSSKNIEPFIKGYLLEYDYIVIAIVHNFSKENIEVESSKMMEIGILA